MEEVIVLIGLVMWGTYVLITGSCAHNWEDYSDWRDYLGKQQKCTKCGKKRIS